MKKSIFALFSVCVIAVSCDKDEPAPVAPTNQSFSNSTVGTNWIYELKTQDPTTLDTITSLDTSRVISGDTTIGSKTYYKVEHNDGSRDYYNHSGSDYFQFQDFAIAPIIDTALDVLYLKEGATAPWTQNLTVNVDIGLPLPIPVTITFTSSIAGTGLTQVVNGITYNDVVRVNTTLTNDAGLTMTSTIVNYYARNIGLIQGNYDIDISGFGGIHNQTLLKYADPH